MSKRRCAPSSPTWSRAATRPSSSSPSGSIGSTLTPSGLQVGAAEIEPATAHCDPDAVAALKLARDRIEAYHRRQLPQDDRFIDSLGVELGQRWTAIEAVGLYVPGGTAAYPSSVLMNAVPAKVAGVPRIVMVVPAPDGKLAPLVLAAAKLAGVDEIYRIGGAQAVAALAYGTETIAPVAKIVGPGNAYVAAAKRLVFGKVGIDMIAGPSEVLILADGEAQSGLDRRRSAGAGRARHRRAVDPDHRRRQARGATSKARSSASSRRCRAARSRAPPGATSAPSSWCAISMRRCRWSTRSRPSIWRSRPAIPSPLVARIRNAGAIFIGHHTPEAIGDYVGRLQPRAADGALRALLVRPRRARLHEAHLDPEARTGAACARSGRPRSRWARPRGSRPMPARSRSGSIRDERPANAASPMMSRRLQQRDA